jgi:hypothetical protein
VNNNKKRHKNKGINGNNNKNSRIVIGGRITMGIIFIRIKMGITIGFTITISITIRITTLKEQ